MKVRINYPQSTISINKWRCFYYTLFLPRSSSHFNPLTVLLQLAEVVGVTCELQNQPRALNLLRQIFVQQLDVLVNVADRGLFRLVGRHLAGSARNGPLPGGSAPGRGAAGRRRSFDIFAILQVVDDLLDVGQLGLVDEVALVHHFAGQHGGVGFGVQRLEADDPLAVLVVGREVEK